MEKKKLEILCTICARGGSKGVYSKNIKNINGRPLISYTIRQAIKAGVFSAIVVSMIKKISNVAKKYGAYSWFLRPKKYASDRSAKLPAIKHAFQQSEKYFKKKFDIIMDLDATLL